MLTMNIQSPVNNIIIDIIIIIIIMMAHPDC